jgi:peptide-methionine (R)-S-oxide reductase
VSELTDRVDVDATVKAVALGRIGLGVAYLATPGLALSAWPGRASSTDQDSALLRLMARSTGGRDIGLGLGVLLAQRHNAPVRGWMEAGMLADVVDAVAIALAFRHLPRTKAVLLLGAALGTAVVGHQLAAAVD